MADLKVLTGLSASVGAAISGSGLLVQEGGITVSNGNIVASSSQLTASAVSASSGLLGSVTIAGGNIDNTAIGATAQSSGKFTTISGSNNLQIGGTSTLADAVTAQNGLTVTGSINGKSSLNLGVLGSAGSVNVKSGDAVTTISLNGDTGVISGSQISGNGSGLTNLSASQLPAFTADVRGQFSGGTGVTITNGSVAIGQAVGTTSQVTFAGVTGSFKGNGSELTNVQAASVAADSVQLGRDTTGNYVASVAATTNAGITIGGTDGEGAAPTVGLTGVGSLTSGKILKWDGSGYQLANSLASESGNTFTIAGTASISGDLLVQGTTTTVNTENLLVKDPIVLIGSASNPSSVDVGLIFGASNRQALKWDHSTSQFVLGSTTNDGSTSTIGIESLSDLKVGALTASAGVNVSGGTVKLAGSDTLKAGTKNADVVVTGESGPQTITTHITGTLHVSGSGDSYLGVGLVNADGKGALGEGVYGYGKNGLVLQGGGVGFQIAALDGGGMGGVTIGAYSTSGETITLTGSAGKVTLEQLVTVVGGGGTPVAKTNYYSARQSVVAHNNSGSTNDVVFKFKENPAANLPQVNQENWSFARITGLSGSSESECLEALGYASIDVMTRDNGVANWTNDLVSVKVEAEQTGSVWYPKITVSAPALTKSLNTKIRLIIVNEKSGSVG